MTAVEQTAAADQLPAAAVPRPAPAPGTVTIEDTLPKDLIAHYFAIYDASWEGMKNKSPCRQYLRADEFEAEALDPRVLKFILWAEDGTPAAISFVATDLSVVPWVAPEYWSQRFPEQYREKRIFYIGSLVVKPTARHGVAIKKILEAISDHIGRVAGIAAFDCSEYMTSHGWPAMIERVGRTRVIVTALELDPQRYWAYVTEGILPDL
jgi:hypothetical protein